TDPVPDETERWLAESGVELIRGSARFVSEEAIAAGDEEIRSEAFVIATGSHPRRLEMPGAERFKTSDDVLELQQPPRRMLIIGAGVVAFEFAHVFARVGTSVVMVARSRPLAHFDEDVVAPAVEHARRIGIEFITSAEIG